MSMYHLFSHILSPTLTSHTAACGVNTLVFVVRG